MGWFEYEASKKLSLKACELEGNAFYSLLFAAMREADSSNLQKLTLAFPEAFNEFIGRYQAPGGFLPGEQPLVFASPNPAGLVLLQLEHEEGTPTDAELADLEAWESGSRYDCDDATPIGAIEDELDQDDDPGGTFLDYGRPGAGDIDPWQEGARP